MHPRAFVVYGLNGKKKKKFNIHCEGAHDAEIF